LQEVPISCGFLAFPPGRGKALAFGNGSRYFIIVFNGSEALAVARRDKHATWVPLDEACRVPGWSEGRIEDGIVSGLLPFRGYVPGVGAVTADTLRPDWTIEKVYAADRKLSFIWLDDAAMVEAVEVPLPADDADEAPASASVTWARDTARRLRDENRIPKGATKAKLARLLEIESTTAAKAGRVRRALKASYFENQLASWGIWPLDSFK
jgi:hypothetical protein